MRFLSLLLALALTGCAGYSVTKNGCGKGYDVYRPDPYLLRVPLADDAGKLVGFEFQVKWLPNYNHRYRVHSWTGFGASNIKFTWENGWQFTGLHDQNSNTEVLKAFTDLTKHLIPTDPAKIAQSGGPEVGLAMMAETNVPVLYKIIFDECGQVCGLRQFEVQDCQGRAIKPPVLDLKMPNGGGGAFPGGTDPAGG